MIPPCLRLCLLSALAVGLFCPAAAAGPFSSRPQPPVQAVEPDDFESVFPIHLHGDSGLHSLDIPFIVYERSRVSPLRDLQVFNADGKSTPFFITPVRQEGYQEVRAYPCFRVRLGIDEQENISLLQDITRPQHTVPAPRSDAPDTARTDAPMRVTEGCLIDFGPKSTWPEQVRIVPAFSENAGTSPEQRSFLVTTQLYASADMRTWRHSGTTALGVLSLADKRLERYSLPAMEGRPPRYLLLVPVAGATLFDIKEVRTESRALSAPRVQSEELFGQWDAAQQGFGYALPPSLPLRALDIRATEENYLLQGDLLIKSARTEKQRPRRLFSRRSEARSSWSVYRSFLMYSVNLEGQTLCSAPLQCEPYRLTPQENIEERRSISILLRPKPGTSWPGIPRVTATWETQRLYFIAQGEGPFFLAVGNVRTVSTAATPAPERLRRAAEVQRSPTAELGPPVSGMPLIPKNHLAQTLAPAPLPSSVHGETGSRKWMLWGVLLSGVCAMTGMALYLLRGRK